MSFNSPLDKYVEYIQKNLPDIQLDFLSPILTSAQNTDWENPTTAEELNNFAVIQLIEAELADDLYLRQFNLELALESLKNALEKENNHLAIAHLGILHSLRGETHISSALQYFHLLRFFPKMSLDVDTKKHPPSLIYFPVHSRNNFQNRETLAKLIQLDNSYLQAIYLLTADFQQSRMVFYDSEGLRFLNLANQIITDSVGIKLTLAISSLCNKRQEGLISLHQARQLKSDYPPLIQTLYLTHRDFEDQALMAYWYNYGKTFYQNNPHNLSWKWASLPIDNPWTYLKFDSDILITVEANFKSIVTSVLLAQEDWFELEMEFWRDQIQEGMTVIDVGANVGVYTFSAAKRVGNQGKVIAVEPFSGCVECLTQTCQVNNFDWVTICQGAAGDNNQPVKLLLHQASELNEIISDESEIEGKYEEVNCFTLDGLFEEYSLQTVDWLKLDAEGNEIKVLQGANQVLSQFKPGILYENVAAGKGNNTEVAEFLQTKGYELFYYKPFLKRLIPIKSMDDLSGKLNVIALPKKD